MGLKCSSINQVYNVIDVSGQEIVGGVSFPMTQHYDLSRIQTHHLLDGNQVPNHYYSTVSLDTNVAKMF